MQAKLVRLRDLISTATELSSVWDYFHAHCAADPRFVERSEPRRNQGLDDLLSFIAARLAPGAGASIVSLYLCIDQLWHGAGVAGGQSFLALWDEPRGVGMACFVTGLGDPMTEYVRFHRVALPDSAVMGKAASA